jgi:hypothetical protein
MDKIHVLDLADWQQFYTRFQRRSPQESRLRLPELLFALRLLPFGESEARP